MNEYNIDDTSNFGITEKPADEPIIIKAVGVGGGGNNAVDHMYKENLKNVSFVNINTDARSLSRSVVAEKLVIGPGLGAGNKPEIAREYAEEAAEKIGNLFDDGTKMVFITAGMGGGTGTGAGPIVARIARERGMLTIGIVTIPFLFEGQKKILKALAGADEMAKNVDALLVINNERLTEIYPDADFLHGFARADDTLLIAARSISELISCDGKIALDFNDVDTTLRDGGAAVISTGYGEGEHRVTKAIQDALNSPLLKNRDIMGSKKLLFNLYFNPEAEEALLMEEAQEITDFVTGIGDQVDVIWGMAYDKSLGSQVKMTILAAGFDVELKEEEDLLRSHTKRPTLPPRTPRQPETAKTDTEVTDKAADRLRKEYGDKAGDIQGGKDRSRYIVLNPDQFDDDAIINILETSPTATRDKKVVEKVKNTLGSACRPEINEGTGHTHNGPLSFL